MKPVAVDLFCGIGGLTHGIQKSGIEVVAGVDIDETCKFAYEENNSTVFIEKDIIDLQAVEIKKLYPKDSLRILMGCAPCQPFSKYSDRYNKMGKKDDKWKLLYYFKNFITQIMPEIISMENVPQLIREKVFKDFNIHLTNLGYHVDWKVVNCAHYGVPQNRKRLVLLASKLGEIKLKDPELKDENILTVRDAIYSLPKINDGERDKRDSIHKTNKLTKLNKLRIKQSKPGGTWHDWDEELRLSCHKKDTGKGYRSVYGRMEWDKPAPTITTQFFGYGNGRFGHPEQDRAISFREGALLQSFHINYKFCNDDEPISNRQLGIHIGNAVPVELGRAIGESIMNHLGNVDKGREKNG